jgi:hypothetical protein
MNHTVALDANDAADAILVERCHWRRLPDITAE